MLNYLSLSAILAQKNFSCTHEYPYDDILLRIVIPSLYMCKYLKLANKTLHLLNVKCTST